MNTVISDNKILRFRIIYFILLVSIVAVAISGYLGIASHYIERDKDCIVVNKLQNSSFLGNVKSGARVLVLFVFPTCAYSCGAKRHL